MDEQKALIDRLLNVAADWPGEEVLRAPCVWCGYGGEGYYQQGTHAAACPWHRVGGLAERLSLLRTEVAAALAAPRPQPDEAAAKTEEMAEWGDAVSAIESWLGPPPQKAIDRLVKAGDALNARIGLMTLHAALAAPRPRLAAEPEIPAEELCAECSDPFGWHDVTCVSGNRAAPRPSGEPDSRENASSVPGDDGSVPWPSGEREAPADLVALVTEWQEAERDYMRPHSAPLAPRLDRITAASRALRDWRPSPPGERPEIRVGDVVATIAGNAELVTRADHADYWNDRRPELMRDERIAAIYRDPLWRRS